MVFLIFIGCSKSSDDVAVVNPSENQLKSASTDKTVSYYISSAYYIPLVCDGLEVGFVFGWPIEWHIIDHYKNGELEWTMYKTNGSLTNRSTGEVFKIQEADKLIWSQGDFTFHANLIGNQGSHYIFSGRFDPITYEVLVDKAVCPNGPKSIE